MKKYFKLGFYGFLLWLIPFAAAFFFYSKEGILTIDRSFFKNIMIIVGTFSAAYFLISYFKMITVNHLKEGILAGVIWFGVNILLDVLILIPMSGMSISNYFTQIGLGYLAIPAMTIAVGAALANKK